MKNQQVDYIVLGGGCSALSLANQIIDNNIDGYSFLILESRKKYTDDKSWCFWLEKDDNLKNLISKSWKSFSFSLKGTIIKHRSNKYYYKYIRSIEFYDKSVKKIKNSTNISLNLGEKVITNSGYFQDYKHQLNIISKSTATHSTLVLDNTSCVRFEKHKNGNMFVSKQFKILEKEIKSEKNYWYIKASHDAYLKPYGVIHERQLSYFHDNNKLKGCDKLIKVKKFKSCGFAIRFHLLPQINLTKLLNKESILIESKNAGWKFTCKNHKIDIETGLYFGMKNKFLENKNIIITGLTNPDEQNIFWEISKI